MRPSAHCHGVSLTRCDSQHGCWTASSFRSVSCRHGLRSQRPLRHCRMTCVHVTAAKHGDIPPIMVNACSGKMGHATAEAVVRAGLRLVPYSFTGESEGMAVEAIGVSGIPVELILPEARQAAMEKVKSEFPGVMIIDYTLPTSVNDNARFYCHNRVPFVMGTTGGDREQLLADVQAAGTFAVIAPNMGKQVVAFQATMELMAEQFPGAFAGYKLDVVESHQRTKADTSGTAKAVVASFQKLGLNFEEDQIERVRDKGRQLDMMGVPEANIDGHAFHTYSLLSPDGSTFFSFTHNVCGREIYAEGSVDAALFLARQIQSGAAKQIYNMIDVLKAGAMR